MSISLFPSDLLIALIVFTAATYYSSRLVGIKVDLNAAVILAILLVFLTPLVAYIDYDYSIIAALFALAILSTKYVLSSAGYISSTTLLLVGILIGGYLLGWLY